MEHVAWITNELRAGTLGALAVKLDRGLLPDHPTLDTQVQSVIDTHALRSSQHLDDVLRGFRDTQFHGLQAAERHDLLRVIQRHADPGFATVAIAYPPLKAYVNNRRATLAGGGVGGGGGDDQALARAFVETFDTEEQVRDLQTGERSVSRRRPSQYDTRVKYNDQLDDTGQSEWTVAPNP